MTATVISKIGPVKATFNGNVTLSNIKPPEGYTISGEGKGGVAGFAKGGADVSLVQDGTDTILRYTAKAQVGGKLAQVGARLIDATAKQMADQFFGAFAAKVGAAGSGPASDQEAVVADVIKDPMVTAEAIEERAEVAAGRGFLGGPMMWGLIALVVVVVLLIIGSRM
jgi:carbon monoxide dehydrogenase subunit G